MGVVEKVSARGATGATGPAVTGELDAYAGGARPGRDEKRRSSAIDASVACARSGYRSSPPPLKFAGQSRCERRVLVLPRDDLVCRSEISRVAGGGVGPQYSPGRAGAVLVFEGSRQTWTRDLVISPRQGRPD